jgi:hypothetical protein
MVERLHEMLHGGHFHYIDSYGTNWDTVVPFVLIAYRATPNTTTKFSPFYLLCGWEMNVPSADS